MCLCIYEQILFVFVPLKGLQLADEGLLPAGDPPGPWTGWIGSAPVQMCGYYLGGPMS